MDQATLSYHPAEKRRWRWLRRMLLVTAGIVFLGALGLHIFTATPYGHEKGILYANTQLRQHELGASADAAGLSLEYSQPSSPTTLIFASGSLPPALFDPASAPQPDAYHLSLLGIECRLQTTRQSISLGPVSMPSPPLPLPPAAPPTTSSSPVGVSYGTWAMIVYEPGVSVRFPHWLLLLVSAYLVLKLTGLWPLFTPWKRWSQPAILAAIIVALAFVVSNFIPFHSASLGTCFGIPFHYLASSAKPAIKMHLLGENLAVLCVTLCAIKWAFSLRRHPKPAPAA